MVTRLGGSVEAPLGAEAVPREQLESDARSALAAAEVGAAEAEAAADRARAADAALLERSPRRSTLDADVLARLVDAVTGLGAGLDRAGHVATRLEAGVRARVDAGAMRSARLGEELRRLGAAEVDVRRGADETAERATQIRSSWRGSTPRGEEARAPASTMRARTSRPKAMTARSSRAASSASTRAARSDDSLRHRHRPSALGRWPPPAATAIGLDWRVPLDQGWARGGAGEHAVQGNLDPAVLLGPWERVEAAALDVLRAGRRAARGTSSTSATACSPETNPDDLGAAGGARRPSAPRRLSHETAVVLMAYGLRSGSRTCPATTPTFGADGRSAGADGRPRRRATGGSGIEDVEPAERDTEGDARGSRAGARASGSSPG